MLPIHWQRISAEFTTTIKQYNFFLTCFSRFTLKVTKFSIFNLSQFIIYNHCRFCTLIKHDGHPKGDYHYQTSYETNWPTPFFPDFANLPGRGWLATFTLNTLLHIVEETQSFNMGWTCYLLKYWSESGWINSVKTELERKTLTEVTHTHQSILWSS